MGRLSQFAFVGVLGFWPVALAGISEAAAYPPTPKRSVTDTYHGVAVTEDYRWIENWGDPAVKKWSDAQNVYARGVLDALPHVGEIRSRVAEILEAKAMSHSSLAVAGGHLFAIRKQPPKQQSFLVVMPSADEPGAARALVDPNVMDSAGTTAIDWYVPSPNGKMVAVSLSKGGTESGDVHVYDTASGERVHEVVPRVNGGTAGGDLAWTPDGSGFFYTRYPRGSERAPKDLDFFQQVYYHKLGTPCENDRFELGRDLPRIAEIQMDMDNRTGRLLVTVQDGDGGEFAHYLRSPDGTWQQFSHFGDGTLQAEFGPNDDLFVISRNGAPKGKVLHMAIADLDVAKAKTVISEGDDTIVTDFMGGSSVAVTKSRVYVEYQLGGPSEIRVFGHAGNRLTGPSMPEVSAVSDLVRLGDDDILFLHRSYVDPLTWYHFESSGSQVRKTALATPSPVDLSGVRVIREFATSKDGTKVPVNILLPKGVKRDGHNPCIAYGYGGYGVSLAPRFRPELATLLEQGVVYAVANLRGGGEYGERWHRQGNLTQKQNVFDDFAGVLQHLIDRGYTSPARLAIRGGSNGGLLMGATMVQHPNLMKAVVSHVGIYDMLRVELSPNGAFNITEFGTVKNPDHFKALRAYSPYHNVVDGTAYPPVIFFTGANDPRVDPMQSRKMTARLQAAGGPSSQTLLRTSSSSGHGGDTALSERIEQVVDEFAFVFKHLGVAYKTVKGAANE